VSREPPSTRDSASRNVQTGHQRQRPRQHGAALILIAANGSSKTIFLRIVSGFWRTSGRRSYGTATMSPPQGSFSSTSCGELVVCQGAVKENLTALMNDMARIRITP
jgi:ABC-type transport system involved in cytochrome c biogenesis ATPase subunit